MCKRKVLFGQSKSGLLCLVLALVASVTSLVAQAAPRMERLTLGGPGAVVSYPLMHMIETQALQAYAKQVEFRVWENQDQLSSLLVHGALDFSAAPSTLPALLYNKGQKTRLLSISVWGLIWLVSTDPQVKSFSDLSSQTLVSPFQHNLGDVLIETLLKKAVAEESGPVQVRHTRSGQDAIALMLSGQAKHVVLAEPLVSMLLWRNQQQQQPLAMHRVQSLEDVWPSLFPGQLRLPQAGLMANATVVDNHELIAAVKKAYADSARWCKSHASDCAQVAHKYLPHIPVAVLQEAIAVTHLESLSAPEIRDEIESLYRLIQMQHPKVIGQALPDATFYE